MFDNFEKLPPEKREMIINICMKSFTQNGYILANTVEIAKECGIAKGSLFYYFGSKKALYLYIVRLCIERIMDETRSALSSIGDQKYFDRVRKSVEIKIKLPAKYPKETALLARAFNEKGSDVSGELFDMVKNYTAQLKALSGQYLGEIEPQLVRDDIDINDAKIYIQTVFDSVTTRLMQQYSHDPSALLDNPRIIAAECEKVFNFILHGIGK